jgi:hypothetical protein
MRERILILGALGLAVTLPAVPIWNGLQASSRSQSQAPAKPDDKASSEPAPKTDPGDYPKIVPKSKPKSTSKPKSKSNRKPDSKTGTKADPKTDSRSNDKKAAKSADPKGSLSMTPAVVCRSIDGYEQFEPLKGAAQTSEEKLLVYLRPLGFKTQRTGDSFEAHLIPDFQIRRRGEKPILLQKKKYIEYKPTSPQPPRFIYLKSVISLKGLAPGEYDLTIILHDEIAQEDPATQVVKFRVIPAALPLETAKTPDGQP